jgi:protein-disulfide isomerase
VPAAKAAICAGRQDARWFWEMHDWLFANAETWAKAADPAAELRTHVLALGADATRYDTCVEDPDTAAAIQRDQEAAISMGVSGTPAFFINDWYVSGAQPYSEFQKVIEKALQGIHPPPTPTPLPPGAAPYDVDPARPGLTYDGSPTLGAANARLVLIAFEDFKCGYCAQFFRDVEPTLKSKYIEPGQLRVVFKFFPIYAPQAAVASLCAAEQGRFWEFHDLLFAKQGEWQDGDRAAMAEFGKSLGLDVGRFTQCLQEAPGQAQVEADYELGQQLGVRGTPYFLLLDIVRQTGLRIPGALPLGQFEQAIAELLNPATATPAP